MKITRPLWAKGIFMTPQHFQQQAIWEQYVHYQVARIASPDAWGAVHVALDDQALSVNRLQCTALALRLPDGTLIDSETADWLPAARSLDDVPATVDTVTVLAGVALMDAQGGNCVEPGEKPARPRRVTREYKHVADLNDDGQEEISVDPIIGIAHNHHIAYGMSHTPLLYPQVERVVKADVRQQRRNTSALNGFNLTPRQPTLFQHTGVQPFLDEPHDPRVRHPMLDEPDQPCGAPQHPSRALQAIGPRCSGPAARVTPPASSTPRPPHRP
ncbi:type VI secretion system baseplate subunit TssK [Burkholderia ubonensis]|uniref:type VI secretion system baseplate subunit TssK n=2 Tax=Burkholderia ubonensis TaxID=101571 RepID=UPI001E649801|nr:type VI secretion system baseplate subunit TssK [Burkholderia ubonensis]